MEAGKDAYADGSVWNGSAGTGGVTVCKRDSLKLASRWLWCDMVVTCVR